MNDGKKHIVGIIPARGGSKGVHRKNIKKAGEKPLIAWTIETAMDTPCLEKIIVSTDDEEIARVGRHFGAEVPFLRPSHLALDDTTDLPVYQHALTWLEENQNYSPDIVVCLRPTAPLRTSEDIQAAVDKLEETNADWVRSVCIAEHHPYWMCRIEGDRLAPFVAGIDIKKYIRRQLLPPVYRINGAVDVAWRETIMEKQLLYVGDVAAYIMPSDRSIDIDTEFDFQILEECIRRNGYDSGS